MPDSLLPQIVRLTPSSYADYLTCARMYRIGTLQRVPASDNTRSSVDQGLLVHDVLRRVHEGGSCHDTDNVLHAMREANADTEQMMGYVDRHRHRCPRPTDRDAHEVEQARFHRGPPPMFLATARIDAVWIHDGILDVRDYKTAKRWHDRLGDDPSARVQAWIMARAANRRGLRLRVRYEYLAPEVDDDPDPWEPDDDDLDAIEEELRKAVENMWGQQEWAGVAEPDVCGRCRYRSVCRDSVAPGEAAWPVLSVG